MTERVKLTEAQRQILAWMATQKDNTVCAQWIAEGCGHAYDTAWASRKLPALVKRGAVEQLSPTWYAITPAGRQALKDPTHEG